MQRSEQVKVVGAVLLLVVAGALMVFFTGGNEKPSSSDLKSMVQSLSDEELINMRQSLAAQVADANRTRGNSEKSKFLIGYEKQLAEYDSILSDRGIDPLKLKMPTLAEFPIRKDEEP
ncbi:MAG: hypothetical protein KDA29_08200 [Phycisphaerales bacterium]|nr:hypothetical protein [Phycisphaerales bacterium]